VKASDDASSSMASVSTSVETVQPPAALDAHQQHVQHAAAAGMHPVDPHAAAPADAASSSSWLLGWTGLGSYFWPDSSAHPAAGGAQTGAPSTGNPESQAGGRSLAGSPWPDESAAGAEEGGDDEGDEWHGLDSPGSGVSNSSTSPLVLLSHVVHMQKELEQQRAQLGAVQQQLEHTNNRCVWVLYGCITIGHLVWPRRGLMSH
jgi:flagellin-like hook-associated protein FlgL